MLLFLIEKLQIIINNKKFLSNSYSSTASLPNPQAGSQEDKCKLDLDSGPCFGLFHRYGYNSANGRCEQFVFGGCGGNANNFETVQECQDQCGGGAPVSGKDTSMDVFLWWVQSMKSSWIVTYGNWMNNATFCTCLHATMKSLCFCLQDEVCNSSAYAYPFENVWGAQTFVVPQTYLFQGKKCQDKCTF